MPLKKAAVITGDIINSSELSTAGRKKLQRELDSFSKDAYDTWPDLQMQQYRGDSIQAILTTNRSKSLRMALRLQSRLIASDFSIRLSLGIGEISFKTKNLITSDGSAFRASGSYLDTLKKTGELISIAGADDDFSGEWQTHSASLNYIIQDWTPQQAEAVGFLIKGITQEHTARLLKITQPSVHQRLQGARWPVVQKILQRFESVVSSL
jgi:hypothetical protein